MSNRRKPRRLVALDGQGVRPAEPTLPWPLEIIDWTDQPAPPLPTQTIEWIAEHHQERGRLNVWVCEQCDVGVLCVDKHPGVTPFLVSHQTLGAEDCDGMGRSVFYSRAGVLEHAPSFHGHTDLEPTHEWYRPSRDELRRASGAVRKHVNQGGLLVREVAA